MKLAASIVKSFKENLRDWKVLVLVLLFSPFFIFIMRLFYGTDATLFKIGVLGMDRGQASAGLIERLGNTVGPDGKPMFKLTLMKNIDTLEKAVKEKAVDLGIVIPQDYSEKLERSRNGGMDSPAIAEFYGSMGNARYIIAAVMASDVINSQGLSISGIKLPTGIHENFLERSSAVNEFDSFVPSLISMAALMILFSATGSIVRENDKKTLIRLKLSRLGAFNFLAGVGIVQAVLAEAAIVLTYWTALALGYRSAGGFGMVLFVGILSSLSMVAISLVTAAFLDTVFDVLTIGCFPFFILMFFSGAMFPLPKMNLFTIAGHTFAVNDILPLTHTANAFNKILNYGEGFVGIAFDVFMICMLTVVYFAAGLALYQRRKLSKA